MVKYVMTFIGVILFLSGTVSSTPVFATPSQESAKWYECNRDADCIIVKSSCSAPVAINRLAKKGILFHKEKNDSTECYTKEAEQKFKPVCKAGQCSRLSF